MIVGDSVGPQSPGDLAGDENVLQAVAWKARLVACARGFRAPVNSSGFVDDHRGEVDCADDRTRDTQARQDGRV